MSTAIITTIPDIPTTTIMNNNHKYNSEDEEDEKPIQPQQQQQQQQQDEEEDNKFDVSSLVTQVQQTSSGHRQYSHHQQPPIQRRTTPMILKKTDQATYSDDHISSTTIYDEEEVVVDEATTVSHQPKQACTTTTVTSTTTSTIIKHEKKHISKRKRFINNLFKPITRCFQQSSKSPSTPEKQKTPTKHQQTTKPQQLQPQDEEALAADVDVVDVETYEQTTTTVVTTTVQTQPPHNTSNNNNNAAQKLKKKKKKKKRSPHDSRSSLAAHSSRGKSKTLLGPQSQQLTGRKTLVLDLDETLVHSKFEPVAGADFQIPIDIEGRQHIVYVMKRPGVDEFLEEMGKIYEVIIFTASLSKYANPLLDQLDKKKVITGRLFREHCTYVDQCYIKDMSRLGRDIDSALIIDNSPACYAFQPRNAMPCTSWFDDQNDTELLQMIPWLQKLSQERTVYETLDQWRQYFGANCQWY